MAETPDFDQLARQTISGSEFHIKRVAEQLRQAWNSRGEADLVVLGAMYTSREPRLTLKGDVSIDDITPEIRRLDR